MPDHSILQRTLGMVGKTVTFQRLNKEISDILRKLVRAVTTAPEFIALREHLLVWSHQSQKRSRSQRCFDPIRSLAKTVVGDKSRLHALALAGILSGCRLSAIRVCS